MKTILVVDDSKENLVMIKTLLEGTYHVFPVPSGKLALEFLDKKSADLILMDIDMPEMNGLEVVDIIKANPETAKIPVLFLTGIESSSVEAECLNRGGDDFIRRPWSTAVLKSRISKILELYELRYNLENSLKIKSAQLNRMSLSSIITIANTVDAKDTYTGGHSLRVAVCSRDIAANLGWNSEQVQNIYNVALLHDIGKIGVPDSILNKPERLTDEEFAVIKTHPVIGNDILSEISILEHVREGAHYHHERWDGRGYPDGLKGEEIPIYARIIAIADSYDAMRSNRVYRKQLSSEKIISEFERCKGTQFDPQLADVFLFMLRDGYDLDPEIIQNMEGLDLKNDNEKEEVPKIKFTNEIDLDTNQDSLTGLFNRSYLNVKVGNIIMKDKCGALMIFDMDDFGRVNDTFGHAQGDRVLRFFAEELKRHFKDDDIVSRLSGDEFAVFVRGNNNTEVLAQKAQKIIDCVRNGDMNSKHDKLLSVSVGISQCPEDGLTFGELYNAAGKALYHGTQNSKSMYHFFGSENKKTVVESTIEDMKFIRNLIEGQFSGNDGALSVDYSDFQNIYNYVYRYVDRNENQVQILLFTITPAAGREIELSVLEQSMHSLDMAVVESLRKVDVGTRYSSNQYIVILTDTDAENGYMVARRVTSNYYRLVDSDITTLSYDLETLEPEKNNS